VVALLVKDIMSKDVLILGQDASVKDALDLIVENRIGCVIITDGDDIVGIVTERDILAKVVDENISLLDTKISKIMSKNVKTISPNEKLEKASEIITENKIKRLPVVKNDKLVGIVTLTDIVASGVKIEEEVLKELAKWFPVQRKVSVGG